MFFVLGPVKISTDDGTITLHSEAQCSLLAALLARRSSPVSAYVLMSELWGDNPPRGAENALQAQVSRLRRRLAGAEPHRSCSRLVAVPPGYQLAVDDNELDAAVFARTMRRILDDPAMALADCVQKIRDALSLWRGPAFGGHARGSLGQALIARYEQARLSALGLLYDNELKLGRNVRVIEELSELIELEPLNERFCEQLMIGLYRSGRQADALATYRRFRQRMSAELGVEPSPTLRRCEMAILEHDPVISTRSDHLALRV